MVAHWARTSPPFKSDPPPRYKPENDSFESFTNSVTDQLHLCFARGEVMQEIVGVSVLKAAIKPPGEDNPYGYRKAEPIAVHRLYCLVILTLCRHCSMNGVRLVLLGALLLPAILRAQTNLPDVPEANPARPTVSTPAEIGRAHV